MAPKSFWLTLGVALLWTTVVQLRLLEEDKPSEAVDYEEEVGTMLGVMVGEFTCI